LCLLEFWHTLATIANLQWFSKLPSPLNGMVEGNHWDQWFSDGFGVRQPLVMMVFDGCAPLVRRWNGYVPSLKSTDYKKNNTPILICRICDESFWYICKYSDKLKGSCFTLSLFSKKYFTVFARNTVKFARNVSHYLLCEIFARNTSQYLRGILWNVWKKSFTTFAGNAMKYLLEILLSIC